MITPVDSSYSPCSSEHVRQGAYGFVRDESDRIVVGAREIGCPVRDYDPKNARGDGGATLLLPPARPSRPTLPSPRFRRAAPAFGQNNRAGGTTEALPPPCPRIREERYPGSNLHNFTISPQGPHHVDSQPV